MKLNLGGPSGQPGKPSMIVGQKGVQYGLQKPEKKGTSLFTIDDDDDLNAMKRMEMEETQRRNQQKAEEAMQKALAEDPMAFEYDAVYKEMKKEEIARKAADTSAHGKPQAKYMENLLKNAEVKQREDMVVLQKKLQRELAAEKEIFGEANETKFVTSAYKREIEQNRIYEAEQAAKEERDRLNTIEARGNTRNFLNNLLDSRSTGRAIKTDDDLKKEKEAKEKAAKEAEERGKKRDRSPSPDSEERARQERERERDRVARLRERAEKDAQEAERLREKREKEKEEKLKELQAEYSKHNTTEEGVMSARERYLARKKARSEGATDVTQ